MSTDKSINLSHSDFTYVKMVTSHAGFVLLIPVRDKDKG